MPSSKPPTWVVNVGDEVTVQSVSGQFRGKIETVYFHKAFKLRMSNSVAMVFHPSQVESITKEPMVDSNI
jgi:hypothetical protein